MTALRHHSSKPHQWISPRPYTDADLRRHAYGKVRPMHEPNWLERLFGRN